MNFIVNRIDPLPIEINKDKIHLPTNGGIIEHIRLQNFDEGKGYYVATGRIFPIDKNSFSIEFQINLPLEWNEKIVQYGGFSFDGYLERAENAGSGQTLRIAPIVQRGYVTFGSDGGHKAEKGNWDSDFALNDEALMNFGGENLKKTRDIAVEIVKYFYGISPKRSFFIGGSNGGREALKAIQQYPSDYDGVFCMFPVLNWVGKAILDSRNADFITRPGYWIDRETYQKFLGIRDEVYTPDCTNELGLISDVEKAYQYKSKLKEKSKEILTDKQIEMMEQFEKDLELPYEMSNGVTCIPGYDSWVTSVLCDKFYNQFGKASGERSGDMALFGDAVIRYQIMRNPSFDTKSFDYVKYREQVQKSALILNAMDPKLDDFYNKGGKLIMMHGLEDQLVSMRSSIAYYRELQKYFGMEKVKEFVRFYLVPGYGHGIGENYISGCNGLELLEKWIETGIAPEDLVTEEQDLQWIEQETERLRGEWENMPPIIMSFDFLDRKQIVTPMN